MEPHKPSMKQSTCRPFCIGGRHINKLKKAMFRDSSQRVLIAPGNFVI